MAKWTYRAGLLLYPEEWKAPGDEIENGVKEFLEPQ